MLALKYIRNNIEFLKEMLSNRGVKVDLDKFEQYDYDRREILSQLESLKHKKNIASQEIGKLKREGQDISKLVGNMGETNKKIKELSEKISNIDEVLEEMQYNIPNVYHDKVPIGNDEENNLFIKKWGNIETKNFLVKPHWELGENLKILDFERGAKLSGSRFTVLRGMGARLERALINFMLDTHIYEHGYEEIITPILAKREIMIGTGQLPKFEDDMYKTTDDMFLISTGEVTLTNLYREEILKEEDLPKYFVGFTPCFRREAGSYGRDLKGLIRQHQFYKVEMVKLSHPNNSYNELEKMLSNAEEILKKLELPYRVVELCSGDLGFSAAKTYDIEVWLPYQNKYREISSCSNCEGFQSRRMGIKYRSHEKSSEYVHTLNGSGLAVGRTLVAILENYQQEDGSIKIPKVLQKYMGGLDVIKL